jgi:hypothetical protein
MAAAFELRRSEKHLSVNWLEYFCGKDLSATIERVREVFRSRSYHVRPNGRFAVLNVGAAKVAVLEAFERVLRIEHMPSDDDESHAGILGYTADDLDVTVELTALVTSRDVHPTVA